MGLEPNLSPELNGTMFKYILRDTTYQLKLSIADYSIATNRFHVTGNQSFGVSTTGQQFFVYRQNREVQILQINAASNRPLKLSFKEQKDEELTWKVLSNDDYHITLKGLQPNVNYRVTIGLKNKLLKVDGKGNLTFNQSCRTPTLFKLKKDN